MASGLLVVILLKITLLVSVLVVVAETEPIEQQHKMPLATTEVTYDPNHHEDINSPPSSWDTGEQLDISEENRKKIIELAQRSLLKVLGLKEAPTKPKRTAFVPESLLKEYKRLRETVRDIIPDDRNFYGKIYAHELEKRHVDMYSASYNKYGEYGIEVDMEGDETGADRFLFKGDYESLTVLKLEKGGEEISSKWEHTLLPHFIRGANDLKQSISVHLKFNLSQELFSQQLGAEEIKAAELHLSREKILREQLYFCDSKTPVPLDIKQERGSQKNNDTSDDKTTVCRKWPRFQRVYLYHILGFDKRNGEPMTRMHDSHLIDTESTLPLMFDIADIIKGWLRNKDTNHGIIVRVTYDEDDIKKMNSEAFNPINTTKNRGSSIDSGPEATTILPDILGSELPRFSVGDHVRLTRQLQSSSEADDVWARKQPILYLFSDAASRRHVKREYPSQLTSHDLKQDEDDEMMQADQPSDRDDKTSTVTTTAATTTIATTMASAQNMTTDSRNSRPTEHSMSRREGRQPSGRSRPSTGGQRSRPKGKATRLPAEKCKMKMLEINFDDVGWNSWIIAPKSYNLNYCAGDCSYPISDAQNASNHAIIQSIFHSVGKVVPKSCCAPTKLANIAILYSLDGVVQMRHYDDMTVESCGCV